MLSQGHRLVGQRVLHRQFQAKARCSLVVVIRWKTFVCPCWLDLIVLSRMVIILVWLLYSLYTRQKQVLTYDMFRKGRRGLRNKQRKKRNAPVLPRIVLDQLVSSIIIWNPHVQQLTVLLSFIYSIGQIDWVRCEFGCNYWFHFLCVGLTKDEAQEIRRFCCLACEVVSMSVSQWNQCLPGYRYRTPPRWCEPLLLNPGDAEEKDPMCAARECVRA